MKVYHCTTPKKLERYIDTGCILPPVRYWTTKYSAERWCKKTQRSIIICFDKPDPSWPLPIKGGAEWTNRQVDKWNII